MLKQYIWNGSQWQFEESEAPKGAVELKAKTEETEVKEKKVANKAKKASTK